MEVPFQFLSGGAVTMNDILTTVAALTAGIVAVKQKVKDEQIQARDETIAFLKSQIEYLQLQLKNKE